MPQHESGIYVIVNTVNHHCYVGSAVDFHVRKIRHFRELRQGKHHSKALQAAYLKYGKEVFTFHQLELVPKDRTLLYQREGHWIRFLQPEYTVGKLGETHLGAKRSEEARKRQSEAALAREKPTEETCKILSEAAKTRVYTDEGRHKRSEKMQGHEVSEESKRKSSEGNKAYWARMTEEERIAEIARRQSLKEPVSEQTRQKQSLAKKGKKQTPEHVQKRPQNRKGKVVSEQTRENMRIAQQKLAEEKRALNPKPPKVYKTDEEHRRRTSEGLKKSWERRKAAKQQTYIQEPLL